MLKGLVDAVHGCKLRGEIALYSALSGPEAERKVTSRMLRLRKQHWPEVKAQFDAVLARLDADALCLDLGANVGDFTRQIAATGAEVHAYEPDPHAFALLQKNVGHLPNVTLHNAAIAGEDGTLDLIRNARFDEDPDHFTVGTGAYRSTVNAPGETITVPAVGFAGLIRRLGRKVDLVKMDIEGSEVDILEALVGSDTLSRIGALFVETHEAQMPDLRDRTLAVRQRLAGLDQPLICLDWH